MPSPHGSPPCPLSLLSQQRLHAPATTRPPLSPLTRCPALPCPALPCPALPCPGLSKSPTAPLQCNAAPAPACSASAAFPNHCTLADHAKLDSGTLWTVLILLARSRSISFFCGVLYVLSCLGWHQLITRKNNCGCCYCWLLLLLASPPRARKSSRASERGMRACVHCFAAPFLFDTCLPLPLHYFNLLHHTRTLPVQLKAPSTKAPNARKTPPAPSRPRQRPSWEAQAIIAALDLSSTLPPPRLE